jgi:hypothetical protein
VPCGGPGERDGVCPSVEPGQRELLAEVHDLIPEHGRSLETALIDRLPPDSTLGTGSPSQGNRAGRIASFTGRGELVTQVPCDALLQLGREAFARQDLTENYETLSWADREGELAPDDLAVLTSRDHGFSPRVLIGPHPTRATGDANLGPRRGDEILASREAAEAAGEAFAVSDARRVSVIGNLAAVAGRRRGVAMIAGPPPPGRD